MKCTEFNNRIDRLFDEEIPEDERLELKAHMTDCPACAEIYRQSREALDALTPRCEVKAPEALRQRLLNAARTSKAGQKPRRALFMRLVRPLMAVSAAAAMVALILFNPIESWRAHAAGKLFSEAAAALDRAPSFYMEIEVRTDPNDNFASIDAKAPFCLHRMWTAPGKWRLEKEGRIALNNGKQVLMWLPFANMGYILPPESAAIEDFRELLDPSRLLLSEEARASRKGATYRKDVGPDTITLTVEIPAEGDFTNDAMRNTSVSESDSRRTYRFDRETQKLESMQIDIRLKNKYVTVARLTRIEYDVPIGDNLFAEPDGIEWTDLRQPVGGSHFAEITPEEAVRLIFRATENWNEALLEEVFVYYSLNQLKPQFKGSKLIDLQPAFRSGQYPGVFVRCLIRTADGKKEKLQIALRNDNQRRAWVVDGGI